MDISYEELVLVERIGKKLGVDTEKIVRTPHVTLMKLLLDKIDVLELINDSHHEMVEDVKNMIKNLEG